MSTSFLFVLLKLIESKKYYGMQLKTIIFFPLYQFPRPTHNIVLVKYAGRLIILVSEGMTIV